MCVVTFELSSASTEEDVGHAGRNGEERRDEEQPSSDDTSCCQGLIKLILRRIAVVRDAFHRSDPWCCQLDIGTFSHLGSDRRHSYREKLAISWTALRKLGSRDGLWLR